MTSKTITLAGSEVRADYSGGVNAWIRNDGTAVVYASTMPGVTAGADGVVSIPAGQAVRIDGACGTVYLLGTGSVQLVAADYVACPFKVSAQSGGSGADEVARAAIEAHSGNAEIHVTAAEKSAWDGKADPEDIPTKISELTNDSGYITSPDGGDAATLGGKFASDFAYRYNPGLDQYLSGRSGDIRALAYLLPVGGYSLNTRLLSSVGLGDLTGFPLSGDIFMIWVPSYWPGGNLYYGMLIMRAYTGGPLYMSTIYNTTTYTPWSKIAVEEVT